MLTLKNRYEDQMGDLMVASACRRMQMLDARDGGKYLFTATIHAFDEDINVAEELLLDVRVYRDMLEDDGSDELELIVGGQLDGEYRRKLGVSTTREFLRLLHNMFPSAKRIVGDRTTGCGRGHFGLVKL